MYVYTTNGRYELNQNPKMEIPVWVKQKVSWFNMKILVRYSFKIFSLDFFFLQTCKDAVLTRLDEYSNAFIAMSALTIACLVSLCYIHRPQNIAHFRLISWTHTNMRSFDFSLVEKTTRSLSQSLILKLPLKAKFVFEENVIKRHKMRLFVFSLFVLLKLFFWLMLILSRILTYFIWDCIRTKGLMIRWWTN